MTIPLFVTVLATILLNTQFASYATSTLFIPLDILLIGYPIPDPNSLIDSDQISYQKKFQ